MTDKELRKLSRLELLELLLEVSKENEKLKEKVGRLKLENETAQNIENLSVITRQVENALEYVNSITDAIEASSGGAARVNVSKNADSVTKSSKSDVKAEDLTDVEIYKRMLSFFAKNDDKLNVFPSDLENNVRARIKSILERRKTN